jgi:hypothetical protein
MALLEANFLTSPSQQAAMQLFAPATNVLSSALNNAVDAGRRMVDLQSHQEDMFLSEREKLRLASERKGLEARRIFENDRNFGEDVLKDRRNFAEGVFRDRRDFSLESAYKMGSLGLQREGLGLQQDRLGLEREEFGMKQSESESRINENNARADYYRGGGSTRSRTSERGDLFLDTYRELGEGKSFSFEQPQGPDILGGASPQGGLLTGPPPPPQGQDLYNTGMGIINEMKRRGVTREDAERSYQNPALSESERNVFRQIIPLLPYQKQPVERQRRPFGAGTNIQSDGFSGNILSGASLTLPDDQVTDADVQLGAYGSTLPPKSSVY